MNKRTDYLLLSLAFIIMIGCTISCSGPKVVKEMDGDVVVVKNPKDPVRIPNYAQDVKLTEELCIGHDAPEGDYVYGDRLNFSGGPMPSIQLLRISPDFNDAEIIVEYEFESRFGMFAPVFDRLAYAVASDDRFLWVRSTKYVIHILNPDGEEIRRIHKKYEAVPITDEEKKDLGERYMGDIKSLPNQYSPFFYFICDDLGRIYVRTYERNEKGWIGYDIFDNEGRFFSRLFLPEEETLMVVKKDKAYCMITESPDEGIPLVKRYTMDWK